MEHLLTLLGVAGVAIGLKMAYEKIRDKRFETAKANERLREVETDPLEFEDETE